MDIITKFLNDISYKFPKGYPDIKNSKDFSILENELKSLGINLDELKKSSQHVEMNKEIEGILDISDITQHVTDNE
jgi:hypothetical protein